MKRFVENMGFFLGLGVTCLVIATTEYFNIHEWGFLAVPFIAAIVARGAK